MSDVNLRGSWCSTERRWTEHGCDHECFDLALLAEVHDSAYAVWMSFVAGTVEELVMTLQNLSAAMYQLHVEEEDAASPDS